MKLALSFFFAFAFIACAFGQFGSLGIKWSGYKSGVFSNVSSESFFVLNNEAEFQRYWKDQLGEKPEKAPRDIKWGQEMLVAVHLGRRNTAGYSVFVKSLDRPTANTIKITYVEKAPATGAIAAQVLTSPFEIIRIERAGGNFEFKKETSKGPQVGTQFAWRYYQAELDCKIRSPRTLVINDQVSFDRYWAELDGSPRAPKDVDWDRETLVAVHLGQCATTGFDVLVTDIDPIANGGVGVSFLERRPANDQRTKRVSSSPYCIVRLPKVLGTVQFDHRIWDNSG